MAAISATVAAAQLRDFVERIERLEEEIKELNANKSEIYKEAKFDGFDVKVLRKVVEARRMDRAERMEVESIFDLYMADLGGGGVLSNVTIEFPPDDEQPAKPKVSKRPEPRSGAGRRLARHRPQKLDADFEPPAFLLDEGEKAIGKSKKLSCRRGEMVKDILRCVWPSFWRSTWRSPAGGRGGRRDENPPGTNDAPQPNS